MKALNGIAALCRPTPHLSTPDDSPPPRALAAMERGNAQRPPLSSSSAQRAADEHRPGIQQ